MRGVFFLFLFVSPPFPYAFSSVYLWQILLYARILLLILFVPFVTLLRLNPPRSWKCRGQLGTTYARRAAVTVPRLRCDATERWLFFLLFGNIRTDWWEKKKILTKFHFVCRGNLKTIIILNEGKKCVAGGGVALGWCVLHGFRY